jgi:hypothetical protein
MLQAGQQSDDSAEVAGHSPSCKRIARSTSPAANRPKPSATENQILQKIGA